jgi:hypothetical protein
MVWEYSNRADPRARALADRHYNRQKIGTRQFVPPGRCLVLYAETETGRAFWVTSWPFALFVQHAWAGAWMCSAFRNEGAAPASLLIRDAVAASLSFFGPPPPLGLVTFIDKTKVQPTMVRGEPMWGWTFRKAGFKHVGETGKGLLALQLLHADMPPAADAIGFQSEMWAREEA